MFYIIGLGLGNCKDVSVKGLEIIKKCDRVYLESYTSILTVGIDVLEEFYGRPLLIADRELVEQEIDSILTGSKDQNVALLVVGDPFGATTHTDLVLRAKENQIPIQIIHNASIINAIGCTGLQLYSFGETVSIPFWTETWKPDSFMEKILGNFSRNLHTLCLLDIRVKEPTLESLTKRNKEYEPPRFMSVSIATNEIVQILATRSYELDLTENSICVGVARVGSETQEIRVCSLKEMQEQDLGPPLHSLVIPAKQLHPLEQEYIQQFIIDGGKK